MKRLVEVSPPGKRPVIFISNFDVYVDLPGSLKGANLSRNFEVIDEVLQEAINGQVTEIEELCSVVARKLLDHHEYADRTEVQMRSEFMVRRDTPVSKTNCHEVVKVNTRAIPITDRAPADASGRVSAPYNPLMPPPRTP